MEDKKNMCNTLPDSDKCYDTEHEISDYGKPYKEQVEETKGPSQEEYSNELYGDKKESDYQAEHIEENPMDKAGNVNTFQSGVARNEEAIDYINKKSNAQGYTEVPPEIASELDEVEE